MRDRATLCFAARPASVRVLTCAHAKNRFLTYLGGFQPMRMEAFDSSSHVIALDYIGSLIERKRTREGNTKFYFDLNSQRNRFLADLVLLNDGTQRILSHST